MSTVTVTPTVEAGTWPPRVRLDVSDANLPAYVEVTVIRVNPDGTTTPVRTADGNPLPLVTSGSNRVGLMYDYEAPYGLGVTYTTAEDPATVSSQVVVDEARVWLIHPGVPELSQPITVAEFGPRVRRAERGVFWPMGRKYPIVVSDGQRKAPEFALSVFTATPGEMVALEALCDDVGALLLNVPVSKGFGVGAEYVSVGDLTEARLGRFAGEPGRFWDLSCQVIDRPTGGSAAERTFADLLSFATFGDLQAAYDTFQDVLSGP